MGSRQWQHVKYQKHTDVNNSGLMLILSKKGKLPIDFIDELVYYFGYRAELFCYFLPMCIIA